MGKEGRYGIINRPLAKRLILNYLVVIHDQSFLSFCLHSIFFIKKNERIVSTVVCEDEGGSRDGGNGRGITKWRKVDVNCGHRQGCWKGTTSFCLHGSLSPPIQAFILRSVDWSTPFYPVVGQGWDRSLPSAGCAVALSSNVHIDH